MDYTMDDYTGFYEVRRRTVSGRELEHHVVFGIESVESKAREMTERGGQAWRRQMWAPGAAWCGELRPEWCALRLSKFTAQDVEAQLIEARAIPWAEAQYWSLEQIMREADAEAAK